MKKTLLFTLILATSLFSVRADENLQISPKALQCVLSANIVGSIIEHKRKNLSPKAIETLISSSNLPLVYKQYLHGFSMLVNQNDVAKIDPFVIVNSYYFECMRRN